MSIEERLSVAIRTLAFAQRAAGDEWVRDSGLTRQQAFTLGYIEEHQDRGVIARELSEVSGTTPASVTSLLQGLEERGLITRRASPDDSRVKFVRATAEGSRLVVGFDDAMREAQARVFAPLTEAEQETLLRLLQKTIDGSGIPVMQGPPARRSVDRPGRPRRTG
ncbi:MarR family winged helix-turn-helix transcriptional regulator [uncultured Microbacterium sp.]|uniref:MarR family winged helix-turn-helix transcriptional regulator n=1 Tax=uncultured Microbacterium sp. TaxID=191216 RepID=UPI0025EDE65D|nr:MarR family transcriptional regulator [uncultured Microbacterium sp.]